MIAFNKDKESSLLAFVLIIHSLFYYSFVVNATDIHYYSYSAIINLMLGMYLQTKNKNAAICSYLLVPIDGFGFLLWYGDYYPDIYDNIAILIHSIQLITITPKRLRNGFRDSIKHFIANSSVFNSIKPRVTMYRITQDKEERRQ